MAQLFLGSLTLCPAVLKQWRVSASSPGYVAQCLHLRISVIHTAEEEKGRRKLEGGTATVVPRRTVLIRRSKHSIPGSWHSYDLPQAALIQKKNGIWRFCPWKLVSGRWWGYINCYHNEDRAARWNVRKENVTMPEEEESPCQKVGYACIHLLWMPLSIQ